MTNDEAKKIIFNQWQAFLEYSIDYAGISEAYKMAMKALEAQPSEAILDKIRAEIESQREKVSKKHSEDEGLTNYYFGLNDGLKDARDIIDKYKAESEEV